MVILPHRRKAFRTAPESGGGGGDPYWNQVALLLHCDGTDGSTTFIDSSNSAHTVTAAGGAEVDTANPRFGSGSVLLNGTTAWLTIPDSEDWHFGTGDFTIEMSVYFSNLTGNREFFAQRIGSTVPPVLFYRIGSGINVYLSFNNISFAANPTIASGAVLTAATWYEIALVRSGSDFKLYIDGSQVGSTYTSASGFTDSSIDLRIGGRTASAIAGAIDEVRITKGVARYTSSFTPPTQAFPDS
jgi:hypothetical protein